MQIPWISSISRRVSLCSCGTLGVVAQRNGSDRLVNFDRTIFRDAPNFVRRKVLLLGSDQCTKIVFSSAENNNRSDPKTEPELTLHVFGLSADELESAKRAKQGHEASAFERIYRGAFIYHRKDRANSALCLPDVLVALLRSRTHRQRIRRS